MLAIVYNSVNMLFSLISCSHAFFFICYFVAAYICKDMLYANLPFHNAITCVSSLIFLLLLWAVAKFHLPSKLCPSLISRGNNHLDENTHFNYSLISSHLVKRQKQI